MKADRWICLRCFGHEVASDYCWGHFNAYRLFQDREDVVSCSNAPLASIAKFQIKHRTHTSLVSAQFVGRVTSSNIRRYAAGAGVWFEVSEVSGGCTSAGSGSLVGRLLLRFFERCSTS